MKDTSYADIVALIEFVYKGEVNVVQSQLASFLKTAEMLQVKGLSGDDDEEQVGYQTCMYQTDFYILFYGFRGQKR